MALSPEGEWEPVFAGPSPQAWVAFARTAEGVSRFSNVDLNADENKWLASWLSEQRREPDEEASYVYVGLNLGRRVEGSDGKAPISAASGLGTGMYFAEPPGSVPSTTMEIIRLARELLEQREG